MENLLKIMDERFVYCSHEITENSIVIQSIVNSSQAKCVKGGLKLVLSRLRC